MERVNRAAGHKITCLMAPAGYGKTIALQQFASTLSVPVLCIDLPRDLDGAEGVARLLARGLEGDVPTAPGLIADTLDRCRGEASAPTQLAKALLELVPRDDRFIMIDGITAPMADDHAVRDMLVALIESSNRTVRWLIAARAPGALPLASWMAYGLMESPVGERDLAFNEEEAERVAHASGSVHCAKDVGAFHELTAGWPTAFVLATRIRARPDHVRVGADRPNHLVFEYLAEQVFNGLGAPERDFLLATSVLPELDLSVVALLALPNALGIFELLRAGLPLIYGDADSDSRYRYQPLFRDFLEYQLRLRGDAPFQAALRDGAHALEAAERFDGALSLALRAGEVADVERIVVTYGFALLEAGSFERVSMALAFLRHADRGTSPVVLSLRAIFESQAANFERADALFSASIEAESEPLERCRLAHRYALELIKRNRPASHDALARILPLLESGARSNAPSLRDIQPALLGAIAISHAILDHPAEAERFIAKAIALVSAEENLRLQASIFHQASYIAYVAGDAAHGSRMAGRASRLAVEQRDYGLAARSFSVQAAIVSAHGDDSDREFEHRTQMLDYAKKAGDHFLEREALAALLDIEAERGDEAAMNAIEAQLEACDSSLDLQTTSLPPARALAASWRGDFRLAYDLVAESGAEQVNALRRGLRFAEVALYGAASGQREEATDAAGTALRAARSATLRNAGDRRRYARTFALCSVAYVLVGSAATANTLLLELERSRRELSPRSRTFVEAARSIYLQAEIDNHEQSTLAVSKLRAIGYGGFARLFEALPHVRSADRSSIALLTRAEIDVLRVLARGGSSTKVAAELGRSVNTVNVHVKSIMRKLGCVTRYEAIGVAREHGLIL
jgi:ATP/maltotriose-dependent transcriptional regulator MalT